MKWKTGIAILVSLTYLIAIIGCAHTLKHYKTVIQSEKPKPFTVKPKEAISSQGYIWPIEGEVLSFFGERSGRTHQGIDICAKSGTKIYAAMAVKLSIAITSLVSMET